MSRAACRREVNAAQHRYVVERGRWRTRVGTLSACIASDREAWTIGGGFASGLVAGLLPIRSAARAINLVAGTLSVALRGPVATALRAWLRSNDVEASASDMPSPPPAP